MPYKIALQSASLSIIVNFLMAVAKVVTGILGSSFALVADGIESLADIFSSILVFIGIKYASKPPDENHPYGHGRAEVLVTIIVVGLLVISALFIVYQSIIHILTPHNLPRPFVLIVLGIVIVIKETLYQIFSSRAAKVNSSSLAADAWHHRGDAITSIAAFIGVSIAIYLGPGYEAADDWAAILAAILILYNAYRILKPALGEIMDENHHHMIDQIRDIAEEEPGILGTEKCFIRKTGMNYHVDLHAIVSGEIPVKEGHLLAHNLKDSIQSEMPEIAEILIHIEPDQF